MSYSPTIFTYSLLTLGICFGAFSVSYVKMQSILQLKPIPVLILSSCVSTILAQLVYMILLHPDCGTTLESCPILGNLFFCIFDYLSVLTFGLGFCIRVQAFIVEKNNKSLAWGFFMIPLFYGITDLLSVLQSYGYVSAHISSISFGICNAALICNEFLVHLAMLYLIKKGVLSASMKTFKTEFHITCTCMILNILAYGISSVAYISEASSVSLGFIYVFWSADIFFFCALNDLIKRATRSKTATGEISKSKQVQGNVSSP